MSDMKVNRAIVDEIRDVLGFGTYLINARLKLAVRKIDAERGGVEIRLYVVDGSTEVIVLRPTSRRYGDNTPYYKWVHKGDWINDFRGYLLTKRAQARMDKAAKEKINSEVSRSKEILAKQALSRYGSPV